MNNLLTLCGLDDETAVLPRLPKRALTLAQELLGTRGAGHKGGPVGHPAARLRDLCPLSC